MNIDIALANDIKGYFYVIMGAVLTVVFYAYIIHLYRSEKKGEADYEKYANIALDDNINSKPVEDKSYWSKNDKNNTQEK